MVLSFIDFGLGHLMASKILRFNLASCSERKPSKSDGTAAVSRSGLVHTTFPVVFVAPFWVTLHEPNYGLKVDLKRTTMKTTGRILREDVY